MHPYVLIAASCLFSTRNASPWKHDLGLICPSCYFQCWNRAYHVSAQNICRLNEWTGLVGNPSLPTHPALWQTACLRSSPRLLAWGQSPLRLIAEGNGQQCTLRTGLGYSNKAPWSKETTQQPSHLHPPYITGILVMLCNHAPEPPDWCPLQPCPGPLFCLSNQSGLGASDQFLENTTHVPICQPCLRTYCPHVWNAVPFLPLLAFPQASSSHPPALSSRASPPRYTLLSSPCAGGRLHVDKDSAYFTAIPRDQLSAWHTPKALRTLNDWMTKNQVTLRL